MADCDAASPHSNSIFFFLGKPKHCAASREEIGCSEQKAMTGDLGVEERNPDR